LFSPNLIYRKIFSLEFEVLYLPAIYEMSVGNRSLCVAVFGFAGASCKKVPLELQKSVVGKVNFI